MKRIILIVVLFVFLFVLSSCYSYIEDDDYDQMYEYCIIISSYLEFPEDESYTKQEAIDAIDQLSDMIYKLNR